MPNINCLICKKTFYAKPFLIKKGKKFCSKRCYTKFQKGKQHKKHAQTTKNKISKKAKQRWGNIEFRIMSIKAMQKGLHSPKCRRKLRKYWNSTEFKNVIKKIVKKGKDHHNWKGGKTYHKGYIKLLKPKHPFSDIYGYVRKSRLVIEKQIKRYLLSTERVHHINKIKTDDRIKNLMAFSSHSAHRRFECKKSPVEPKEIIFDGHNI